MALIDCYECKQSISSLAPVCIHCGAPATAVQQVKPQAPAPTSRHNAAQNPAQHLVIETLKPEQSRPVETWLIVMIFLLPQFFSWFLLRPGHSLVHRILGFSWMLIGILGSFITLKS